MDEFEDLKEQFASYLRVELGRAQSTIDEYLRRFRRLETRFGKPIQDITTEDLRSFKAHPKNLSRASIKTYLVAVRAFHEWGALEGHWPLGTIAEIRTAAIKDPHHRPALSADKASQLLDACRRPLDYRLIYLGLYAGLRIAESARISAINWQDDVLWFRGEKGGRMREVPIHPDLEAVKYDLLAAPPTLASTLHKVKKRIQDRVGFHFTSHQLRKTFATTLFDSGVPDEVVKDLLGHSGSANHLYAAVSPKRRAEAIALLSYGHFPRRDPDPFLVALSDMQRSSLLTPSDECQAQVARILEPVAKRDPALHDSLLRKVSIALETAPCVRTVGYYDDDIFLFDCKGARWHRAWRNPRSGAQPEGGPVCDEPGRELSSLCGETFVEADDQLGAVFFAAIPSDRTTYCVCIRGHLPEKAAPVRMEPYLRDLGTST